MSPAAPHRTAPRDRAPCLTARLLPWLLPACLLLVPVVAAADDASAPAAVGETPDVHAETGIRRLQADPAAAVPAPPRDAARAAALARIEDRVACACYQGGDLVLDKSRSVVAPDCTCPLAGQIRSDLEQSLASLPTAALADRRRVAEQLEAAFVPRSVEYERVFRYPEDGYKWFMEHVRCVCDGCKPTIFFSKCQLTCTPMIVYRLRARIFLALGFSVDQLIDYYLAEYNAGRAPRERKDRDWLLPGKQKEQGWLVPALAIPGMGGVLLWLAVGWVRRGRRRTEAAAAPVTGTPAAAGPPAPSAADRERVQAALDAAGDDW